MGGSSVPGRGAIAVSGWPRAVFYLLQFTWSLSVNLAGLLLFLGCCGRFSHEPYHNSVVTRLPGNRGGLSLGIFIFLSTSDPSAVSSLRAHEYGHTIQCLFLGPLYWLIIAIPSFIWCHCFSKYRARRHVPYEALYCERWATAWGRKWIGT